MLVSGTVEVRKVVFWTFWDRTDVPDDAKMSQEEEPGDQDDSKNQTIKNAKERSKETNK